MSLTSPLKDATAEIKLFARRSIMAMVGASLLVLVLIARLVYLQIVGHEHYASLAKNNRIRIAALPPTRGLIYDRHNKILAENVPIYTLEIVPEDVKDVTDTVARLQQLLAIPDETVALYHRQRQRERSFTSTPLLTKMTPEQVARFSVQRPYFPGVDIKARLARHYPYKELTSHVVGYVGRINEKELKSLPVSEYRGTQYVGKVGVELAYEASLHGKAGYAEIETNAQGRSISVVYTNEPEAGADIHLTLDIDLQKTAYDALDIYNGAVVALEIKTGGVLVLVSRPGFDPNPFVHGIPYSTYQELQNAASQPLFNRALKGQYPPGSTVKPFMGLAALEYQMINFQQKKYCPGFYQLPNVKHKYRDWKRGGHGAVDMGKAIVESCDVYFYDLALGLGIDRIHQFLGRLGFGQLSGIDLLGERDGLLPSKDWKRVQRNQAWYPGETLIAGIGQGYMQATPLQLARATATLANRGQVVSPHLLAFKQNKTERIPVSLPEAENLQLDANNVSNILTSMVKVVHSPRGTAKRIASGIPYQIGGKTGTAQVFSVKQEERYDESQIAFKLRDHALFIAFAPADDPEIAVAVIAENGSHGGSVAAPIAAKVIRQYLHEAHDDSRIP
ncbi:MAG: penicillin-binding protein 2 [Methylococcales bacterium]|nr:penicillin-binding protein 2 [Methylococcales bacterium]